MEPEKSEVSSDFRTKMTPALTILFAICCGVLAGNLYYAQPIIGLIAPQIHMSANAASLIVSLTQVGFACGLLLLVPLGDIVDNRRLMLITIALTVLSLLGAATTQHAGIFLAASMLIGFCSVSVQLLIPLAAHLTPEAQRG